MFSPKLKRKMNTLPAWWTFFGATRIFANKYFFAWPDKDFHVKKIEIVICLLYQSQKFSPSSLERSSFRAKFSVRFAKVFALKCPPRKVNFMRI